LIVVIQALIVAGKVLAACGFFAAFGLAVWWTFPRSRGRMSSSTALYPGGMTSQQWTGSYGTAWLELRADEAVLRGRGPFRPFIRWTARYVDIVEAKAVRGLGKSGLLLCGPSGKVAFWTPQWSEMLSLFELREVPVIREVTKIRMRDFY
jgi:hypothetical protein